MTCPAGYHPRRAYTIKKTGTRVAASCVRRSATRAPTTCGSGQILRSPYSAIRRGRTIRVAASCIKNVGNPGKGLPSGAPGIGPLRKGDLSRFGYSHVTNMTTDARRTALGVAVKAYGSLTLWRKLNALYVYTRNTSPASSAIFKADRDWIRAHYGIAASV